jgi:hypothetical protein
VVSGQVITLEVSERGDVQARRISDNAPSPKGVIGYRGLDQELIGLFENWLHLRDRVWQPAEIRVFGSLLHRCLFNQDLWFWIQQLIDESADRAGAAGSDVNPLRIELVFPAEPPYSRLSAVPWEFLYRPDQPTKQGTFLAADPAVVLSRRIKLEGGRSREFKPEEQLRVLVVISRPGDRRLEPVVYEDVLEAIQQTCTRLRFSLTTSEDPTAEQFRAAATQESSPPHLIHFMGHGEFDPGQGRGALALSSPEGGTDWVDDRRLADLMASRSHVPRAVVLHSCDAGRADFSRGFAGVAPQLVRAGVQCVVAMQYAVTNETAINFSTALYESLAAGADLDVAVQSARSRITSQDVPPDPRLLGVPVVYLQDHTALLASRTVDATPSIEQP